MLTKHMRTFPIVRSEEEETAGASMGFTAPSPTTANRLEPSIFGEALDKLIKERQLILSDENLNPKEKSRLLESTRFMLLTLQGGKLVKSDKIVYAILMFGAAVIIILALLTSFFNLPKEVTLTFVGTVVGGTIATMAQKLGRL